MCGIIGYVGNRPAVPILLDGLKRLEYRGYDSAGIAVISENGELSLKKSVGKLSALTASIEMLPPPGTTGMGHTRWATHGKPSVENAHPHQDCKGEVVVIHNGIIENYMELKQSLTAKGHHFLSQTDSEVLPHLVEGCMAVGRSLEEAVRDAVGMVHGANALIVVNRTEPNKMVAVRIGNAGGLVVGHGQGETFLASDLPAILPYTKDVVFLSGGEMVVTTPGKASYFSIDGKPLDKRPQVVAQDLVAAAKGGYKHFMFKEIMEQPEAVMDTLRGRIQFDPPDILLEGWPFSQEVTQSINRVVFVACGTASYAGLVGKFVVEGLARLPAEVDYGSEFRYRDPVIDENTLLVAITQSGETADTLAAMEEGLRKGAKEIVICNTPGSQATRLAHGVIYTRSGQEIGVAATKTFTGQLVALYLLAAYLGKVKGVLDPQGIDEAVHDLARLPHLMGKVLEKDAYYGRLANRFFRFSNFLYLGRGVNYPIALEGALKLKEVSYIHAEGYPAGEMKHGPIALIDENMPVVAIALRDRTRDKVLSNILEVKARDGIVIALTTEGDEEIASRVDHVISIPEGPPLLTPVLAVMPLQLLAYHIAVRRGCDVDQPRNLAKSVTVE